MSHTALFLWISAASALGRHEADLRDFAASRGLGAPLVRSLTPDPPVGEDATSDAGALGPTRALSASQRADAERADELESELEHARTAIAQLELEQARLELRHVESELRAHAELPQAAFLMAECFALQVLAAPSTRQALEAEAARAALEGPRARAFAAPGALGALGNEEARAGLGGSRPRTAQGLAAGDELELDGAAATATRDLLPGLHHARVLRRGLPVLSQFFVLGADQSEFALPVPEITPCTEDDFARLELGSETVTSASSVNCASYFLAAETQGGIRVASCGAGVCSPFVEFRRRAAPAVLAPLKPPARASSSVPIWATVGAAAALTVGGLVLWRAGVFDGKDEASAGWEYGGTRAALRF